MFENLTERLGQTLRTIRGQGRLTEKNISDSLREVRTSLLEADVALAVVKSVIERIQEQALGSAVLQSISPGQAFVKIVHDQLIELMGSEAAGLNLATTPPAVILMAGLQGSGKTTSCAKLARYLKETLKKSVLVASTDIYRPAAIDQLQRLAAEVEVQFHPSTTDQNPVAIVNSAIDSAKRKFMDVVIIDTAGRLHIDEQMMGEIKQIHHACNPIETLFVVDSMTGQDAANTALAFHQALPLTGVILTKIDGDARGGAALSIREITGKPIKFIGVGEKTTALELFHPERIASRILGMGDILSLVEEAQATVDTKKAERLAKKIKKGKGFNLEDFLDQLQQMRNMGGVGKLLEKLPGMSALPKAVKSQVNDSLFIQFEAIINSMTPKERYYPQLIKASRKKRIADGSGTKVQDVNKLLKQFEQMQKMMKKLGKGGGMFKMMKQMKDLMPPGEDFPF